MYNIGMTNVLLKLEEETKNCKNEALTPVKQIAKDKNDM